MKQSNAAIHKGFQHPDAEINRWMDELTEWMNRTVAELQNTTDTQEVQVTAMDTVLAHDEDGNYVYNEEETAIIVA